MTELSPGSIVETNARLRDQSSRAELVGQFSSVEISPGPSGRKTTFWSQRNACPDMKILSSIAWRSGQIGSKLFGPRHWNCSSLSVPQTTIGPIGISAMPTSESHVTASPKRVHSVQSQEHAHAVMRSSGFRAGSGAGPGRPAHPMPRAAITKTRCLAPISFDLVPMSLPLRAPSSGAAALM